MSVYGLLTCPLVVLIDATNCKQMKQLLMRLKGSCPKVYVLAHYVNSDVKKEWQEQFPGLIWYEAGESMIYDTLCIGGQFSPQQVTFWLLPSLLTEGTVTVLHDIVPLHRAEEIRCQIAVCQQEQVDAIEKPDFSYLDLERLRQTKQFEKQLNKAYEETYG